MLVGIIFDGTAKTKLVIPVFLYCIEFVKNSAPNHLVTVHVIEKIPYPSWPGRKTVRVPYWNKLH